MSSHSVFSGVPYEKLDEKRPIIMPESGADGQQKQIWASKASHRIVRQKKQKRRGCCPTSVLLVAVGGLAVFFLLIAIFQRIALPRLAWMRHHQQFPRETVYSVPVPNMDREPNLMELEDTSPPSFRHYGDCEEHATTFGVMDAHQQRVDAELADALSGGKLLKDSPAMRMARRAFKQCVESDTTNPFEMSNAALDAVHEKVPYGRQPARSLGQTVGFLQGSFGVETLFKLDVAANYKSPDDEHRPFLLYLDEMFINNVHLTANTSGGDQLSQPNDDSSLWVEVSVAEANERWPFFDFHAYFTALTNDSREVAAVMAQEDFRFVVKCVGALNTMQTLIEESNGRYLLQQHLQQTVMHQLEKRSKTPRRCAADIRRFLPHVASRLYAELYPTERLVKSVETVRDVRNAIIDEFVYKAGDILDSERKELAKEKLRKVGTSYGTPEWLLDRQKFEFEHRDLDVKEEWSYDVTQIRLRRFAFTQNIRRVINKNEALRSSHFAMASSADVKVEYSRLGNWMYIPSAVLTMPVVKRVTDKSKVLSLRGSLRQNVTAANAALYASLGWEMAKELSKSIDEKGLQWSVYGIHSFAADSQAERLISPLREINKCLSETTRTTELSETTSQIVGLMVAFETFTTQYVHVTLPLRPGEATPRAIEEAFFQKIYPIMCTKYLRQKDLSKTVFDYVKAMVAEHRAFEYADPNYILSGVASNCPIAFS